MSDAVEVPPRAVQVWYDPKNLELLQKYDKGRCGGVPFFYNKRSRRFICGATSTLLAGLQHSHART